MIEEDGILHSTGSPIGVSDKDEDWDSESEGDSEGDLRGYDGIVVKDEEKEEARRATRVAEMVANIDRVLEQHGRSLRPRVAK